MKCARKSTRGLGWIGVLLALGLFRGLGGPATATAALPNYDSRSPRQNPAPNAATALAELTARVPGVRVDFDELLGAPSWVTAAQGFLTGPGGQGRGISSQTLAAFPAADPDRVTKAFLNEHRGLFGHGAAALADGVVKRQFLTAHNGLRTMVWQQQVDGIPVFEALLISHTTAAGELVSISSHFVPDPVAATGADATTRAALVAKSPVPARQAIALAARNIGGSITPDGLSVAGGPSSQAYQEQHFTAPALKHEARAQLVWLPMDSATLRLCWEVFLMSKAQNEMYRVLIDAQNGKALLRHCLTENISNASYLVYTNDSPTPMSPGYSTPVTSQPAVVARVLVVTNAFDTNASPNGWINDGGNQTQGNNVEAYLDRDGDGQPDLPLPQGSPFRVFAPTNDLTQDPLNFGDAAVVNLFYWNNWMHDRLYELGFTEAAGNFQSNNFARGGRAGDPVLASAQTGGSGGADNNASFTTMPDGTSGLMQMYVFNGPTPNRDGDFDTQVILHEYTHGLSNRRVGGGVGITAKQSLGLGEGWSDFYSLALLSKPGDDVNGTYPEGSYVAYEYNGLEQNYYFGIRRYPYCTDITKSPGTFRDIDPGQYSSHPGIPSNPALSNAIPSTIPVDEKHNVGEIWCAALWDARANLIAKFGSVTGNQLILQLVTDGMNLTPANPTFVQARDAVIQADVVDNSGANYRALWQAFAKRGLGYGAVAPPSSSSSGVVESYSLPDDLLVLPQTNLVALGIEGGAFMPATQTCTLRNTGTNTFNWGAGSSAAWLNVSPSSGTLASNTCTNVVLSFAAPAFTLPIGVNSATITVTNLLSGNTQSRLFTLTVQAPAIYTFALNSDPGWPRQGAWTFGRPTGSGGAFHGNPDPSSGATGSNVFGVNLNGDYSTTPGGPYYLTAGPFNFSTSGNITLQFERWLNSDVQSYAAATIDVSNDGTNWSNIFANGNTVITDSAWTNCQYDISTVADAQSTVYVRWGYQITAGAFPYSGWNIDNINFLGLDKLRIALPASATEGDGTLHNEGTVLIPPHPPAANVTVSLASSDTTKLTVPNSVTILAGHTNASFDLTIIDNGLLDGTKQVYVSASAYSYSSGSNSMAVFDNESATLAVALPPSATEGDPPVMGLITSSAAPANDIAVSLSSSDTNSVQVPTIVVLPAGQTNVAFSAQIIDDHIINGDRNVTITAHVQNWTDGTAVILIHDNETTNLTLVVPSQVWASNGTMTNSGRVEISGTLMTNLPVALSSSDTTHLVVPSGVVINAGQTSAVFNVTVVDTGAFGTIPVVIDSSAAGFVDGQATVNVSDDQTPPQPFNPSPPDTSSNNPVTVQLAWSPGLGEGVEQLANGDFEAGSLTNWTVAPGTNGGFVIDSGSFNPPSGDSPTPPFAGSFCCVSSCSPPGSTLLYRDFQLPSNAGVITLSWVDRIRNFATTFATNQQFRVELRNTNNVALAVIYFSEPSDPPLGDWNVREADLTPWRGQIVRLAFMVNAALAYLDVHLDNVSVRASNLPTITYDVYWGTNSPPAPSDLLGSTTNAFWPLPPVSPLVQYFWQIVANRANQTPGPVWEFSSLSTVTFSNRTVVAGYAGPTNAIFNFQLDVPSSQPISVDFGTADGTAFALQDYIPTNGTLVFNPGETNKIIPILVTGNTNGGPGEAFYLTLANPVNLLPASTQQVCNIVNGYNMAPTLGAISNRTVHAGYTLTFQVQATDPDMDTITYTLDPGAPGNASIDPASGIFSWTPADAQIGTTNSITVRASDNGLPPLSAASTFTVTVVARPQISSASFLGNRFNLSWTAIPSQTYRVQYKTNLFSPWANLSGDVTATSGTAAKIDATAAGTQRFYRVLVVP